MTPEILALLVVLGLLTYGTRVGGYVAMRFVRITPRVRQWLNATPMAVIGAFLAPIALAGGIAEIAGIAVTAAATRVTGDGLISTTAGVITVAALRVIL
jgi:uncharacterized membrane protein